MEIVAGSIANASRVALLPGAFHPPTVAHLGMANAALIHVDAVVLTLPRTLPHKSFDAFDLSARLRLLIPLATANIAVAVADGGLFLEMAREFRQVAPDVETLYILCGRDAAERIVAWQYEAHNAIGNQLAEYRLLVAARNGRYAPPPHLRHAITALDANWDEVSSTRAREAIARGEDWRSLVPMAIHAEVERSYRKRAVTISV